MKDQKNIVIPLDEKSEVVLVGILQKHNLQEGEQFAFKKTAEKKLLNETVVIRLIRNLLTEKISNTEFVEALHKGLETSKEVTKNLAIDIVDNLIPLLEKIPEGQLGEYNRKKQLGGENRVLEISGEEKKEAFAKAKEELLKKIAPVVEQSPVVRAGRSTTGQSSLRGKGATSKNMPMPYKKTPDIKDVEDNAKNMENNLERPAVPQKEVAPAPQKSVDPYKETL